MIAIVVVRLSIPHGACRASICYQLKKSNGNIREEEPYVASFVEWMRKDVKENKKSWNKIIGSIMKCLER